MCALRRQGRLKDCHFNGRGCVAKNKLGHKKSDPGFDLCGNQEEVRYESDLTLDGAFAYSLNLPFSDDVHCLEPADGPPRRLETEEAESGIDSTFDESVVLLEDIIEVFALS